MNNGVMTTERILSDAARQVLEAMFFTSMEEPAEDPPAPGMLIDVAFRGELQGRFQVRIQENCARALAANFTGSFDPEELTEAAIGQVMCELANMLCGATLSQLSPETIFDLDPPRVSAASPEMPLGGVAHWVHTSDGPIHLHLTWERTV